MSDRTPQPLTDEQLAEIQARLGAEHLTPGPWRPEYEQCDCSDGYCHHGAYVAAVATPEPTPIAAERLARTGEAPRDYDFSRTDMGDFSAADWELMARARQDVPALLAEVQRLKGVNEDLRRKSERDLDDVMKERDEYHEAADKLAYAVAPEEVIGEHSSMNCPWENALDLITPMAEVDRLKVELAKRPSRYSATPAQVDDYLRRNFTEDVVLNFQRAIGNRAVEEAAKDIRMESHTPLASELYLNGMKFAADHIDPLKGGGHYPSSLLCSKHDGFGQCPGAPWCTPRDAEEASS